MASSNEEQSSSSVPDSGDYDSQPRRKVGKKMFGAGGKIRDNSPEIPAAGVSSSQFHS